MTGSRRQSGRHRKNGAPPGSLYSVAEGDEDLANMDPARLQMILDDIETGWAFEASNTNLTDGDDQLLDRSGVDLHAMEMDFGGKMCVCEFDCNCV